MNPHQLISEEQFKFFMYGIAIIFITIYFAVANPFNGGVKGRRREPGIKETSPLPDVIPLGRGTVAGCPYVAVASSDGRIDIYVTLRRPLDFRLVISGAGLPTGVQGFKRLELEGNFPDVFQVYCEVGHEAQALELLDPADMAYLIDFCKGYELRFEGNSFVISQPARPEIGDATSVLIDAESFVAHNRVFWKQFQ